jgi:hypothetical protein
MFDRYNIVSPADQQEAARRIAAASEAAAQRVADAAPSVVTLRATLRERGQNGASRGTLGHTHELPNVAEMHAVAGG